MAWATDGLVAIGDSFRTDQEAMAKIYVKLLVQIFVPKWNFLHTIFDWPEIMNKKSTSWFFGAMLLQQLAIAAPCKMNTARIERIVKNVAWVWTLEEDRVVKIRDTEIDLRGNVGHIGPIEVALPRGRSICVTSDVDLVEQPFAFAGNRYFYFSSGDAISVQVKVIDLKNCTVVWQSEPFERDNVPLVSAETSQVKLSQSWYPIGASCLPPLPSAKMQKTSK